MNNPRPVRTLPWTWHYSNGRDEKCIALSGGFSRRIRLFRVGCGVRRRVRQ